jgi:VanZ family protein
MWFERSPIRQKIAVAAILLVILVITLSPAGNRPPLPFSFEVGLGSRWLSDGILNLCLFVPFGMALGWKARSPAKTVFCGLLLSTVVELAQMRIPGRDPALSDILANTIGTTVGALIGRRPNAWLAPDARNTVVFTALGVGAATLVMTLTGVLAAPVGSFAVTRDGRDLVIGSHARAEAAGLDLPEYWLPHAFPDSASPDIRSLPVLRDGPRWYVSIRDKQATLGPTVGTGWALLGYTDRIARRWGGLLDAAWVLVLCVPIGFWARTRRVLLAAVCVVVLVLLWLPELTGIVSTPLTEWMGAALGILAGALIRWLSRRLSNGRDEKTSLSERRR